MARNGQIYGNKPAGSESYVTNGMNFSYPGYSETLCGFADPRIDSNDKNPNPNVTMLEWLHRKPAYRGRVAAFGAWDTFPAIFNDSTSRVPGERRLRSFYDHAGQSAYRVPEQAEGGNPDVGRRAVRLLYVFHCSGVHENEEAAGHVPVARRNR